MKNSQIDQKDL